MEQYTVTGMSCAACQARVEKAVSKVEGVTGCSVSLLTNSMGVEGTAAPEDIIRAVTDAGYGASLKNAAPDRGGSAGISAKLAAEEEALKDHETPKLRRRLILSLGFLFILMYFSMGHMMFGLPLPAFFEGNHVAMGLIQMVLAAIVMIINQKFFTSGFRSLFHGAPNMDTLIALGSMAGFVYSTVILFLMTRAAADGNTAAVTEYMMEFYFESSAMILALITVGKMLEAYSKGKTTSALKSLMKLAPKTATLVRDGQEVVVPIDEVRKGDIFVVRPGENIPVDGIVLEGTSAVNESALTGESIPVDKEPGSEVSSATLNQSGFLKCEASRIGEDTTLSQIIKMVSDAAATKAPVARLADRISGVFVPVVIGIALVTFVIWKLLAGAPLGWSLARAITVLVVSCPCALGLATPVAIMVGSGVGARNGILFKTAVSLEQAGKAKIVALDKTGTITTGEPAVTDILPAAGVTEQELLSCALALEQKSEHPLAKAIVGYAEGSGIKDQGSGTAALSGFRALPGNGLEALLEGKALIGGSVKYVTERLGETRGAGNAGGGSPAPVCHSERSEESVLSHRPQTASPRSAATGDTGPSTPLRSAQDDTIKGSSPVLRAKADELAAQGKTPLLFAWGDQLLGLIAVADVIKPESSEAVKDLQNMGMHVVMLTGDNERTANAIAAQAGVDEVVAGVLPEGKEAVIRELQSRGPVLMVGDGINDAPALTRADVGVAIGAGTDVAIDAADVVLMKSKLSDVPAAVRLSRATLRNIHENLFWAFLYNTIGIPLAAGAFVKAFGWTMNPMVGAAAMSLSSFCVVTNALRLNFVKLGNRDQATGDGPARRGSADPEGEQPAPTRAEERVTTISVKGMMCHNCERHVREALEALPGIASAEPNFETGLVRIVGAAEEAELKAAVTNAGYKYRKIVR